MVLNSKAGKGVLEVSVRIFLVVNKSESPGSRKDFWQFKDVNKTLLLSAVSRGTLDR